MIEVALKRRRIDNPRVSVVIPTYNRANDLRRCLDSLIRQTIVDFEVLVCDDGSTDDTANVCREYIAALDISRDYSENFGGPARPRNRGLRLARAPYVAFLDSDDWWTPKKLEISLEYLDRGADVVYHDLFVATKPETRYSVRRSPTRQLKSPVFDDLIANGNALTNSSVVVRKVLLASIGGFSEERNLIAAEDYDAWIRLAKVTEKFVRIPNTLGYYWEGGGNISNPSRLLRNIESLETLYWSAFSELGSVRKIYWINYAKGRAYYSLRHYNLARKYLQLIRWGQSPFMIWLKSNLALLIITMRGEAR